ncbi:MAG: hypothetical protein RL199_1089 [Pseudomonadota bacterium]|jgi:uncharacterized protein YdiU (UPF0061 family)
MRIPFDNSSARLPERFHARCTPTPVAAPGLVRVNAPLCRELGIDADALAGDVAVLAGNRVPEGADPIALAYAGHQFGHFVPQLGDGRAILMGEVVGADGLRRDLQWKGSGRTPFSRGGDGRAALGPVLREYVVSEAMHALGVPTTRALAAVTTGEYVLREEPLPGAVLLRAASSHLRVGTFQFFAARGDHEGLRLLADHAIARHDPSAAHAANPYRALLEGVARRQASLVAKWMSLGFIHGVMNTDNATISGETLDYGPCAYMEGFHPDTVFSAIDRQGRYAWGNQPRIAAWNLARLAEALLPLLGDPEEGALASAREVVSTFGPLFETAYRETMTAKLGCAHPRAGDEALVEKLLALMTEASADFTLTFRALADASQGDERGFRARVGEAAATPWLEAWRRRLAEESAPATAVAARLRAANPVYVPRNHLVEAAIRAATDGDFGPFHTLCDVTGRPFEERPGLEPFAAAAREEERVVRTFCGT